METYVKKLPLQTIREINGHSISDLSKSIGMSHSAIYDIENRNKKPRIGTKYKIQNFYKSCIIDWELTRNFYNKHEQIKIKKDKENKKDNNQYKGLKYHNKLRNLNYELNKKINSKDVVSVPDSQKMIVSDLERHIRETLKKYKIKEIFIVNDLERTKQINETINHLMSKKEHKLNTSKNNSYDSYNLKQTKFAYKDTPKNKETFKKEKIKERKEQLLQLGCKVENYGEPPMFLVNNKFLISQTSNKWQNINYDKWYSFKTIEQFVDDYINGNKNKKQEKEKLENNEEQIFESIVYNEELKKVCAKHTSNYNDNRIIDVNVSASYYQLFKKLLEWKYRNDFQYPNIDAIRLDWLQFKQVFKEWENNWIEE